MRKIGFLAAVALLGAIACDSVLDIDEPKPRPDEPSGDAGEAATPSAGSSSGGTAGSGTLGGGAAGTAAGHGGGGGGAALPLGGAGGDPAGGTAGEPPAAECTSGDQRCRELNPEICDASGQWVPNAAEADGECPALCVAGKCAECETGDRRCTTCEEGDQNCSPRLPQTCVDGAWQSADAPCKAYCDVGSGECASPPSCTADNELGTTCQPGVSCCTSMLVPGGSFYRNFDDDEYAAKTWPATVSPFYLDKFEVTVGRFRQFVLGYDQLSSVLTEGAGKSPHIAADQGWNTTHQLPSKSDLLSTLAGCPGTTWSDTPNADADKRPINCVPFEVAYAFCVWDRGRLPTETEWNFAAAGGAEQRAYPWKAPLNGPAISPELANYDNANPGPVAAGLTPAGDGRWGQSDLAGNVIEWTLDYWISEPSEECTDCLNVVPDERTVRGGSYPQLPDFLKVSARTSYRPEAVHSHIGFRCARDSQ